MIALAAAAAATDGQRFDGPAGVTIAASGVAFWLAAGRTIRQYDADNGRGFAGDLALTLAMVAGLAVEVVVVRAAFPALLSTLAAHRFLALAAPALLALRAGLVSRRIHAARPEADVLIVGVGALGRLTGSELLHGSSRRRPVGYLHLPGEESRRSLAAPVVGGVEDLESVLRGTPVDEVYFASTAGAEHGPIQSGITVCERLGVPFALPVCAFRLTRARPVAGAMADGYAHFSTVRVTRLKRGAKRLFDIVASGAALVALSWVLALAALAVKLTSKGPVLFRQERVGLLGRRFRMLKLRTMVVDAERLQGALAAQNEAQGPVFKMRDDPRVTPVGRFLRKFSIDELPQLLNVLRGDMSIVGPRPPLPSEVAKYEAWQLRRLSVRPGLTCTWQVSGRSEIAFDDWMLLDMRYIDHWTFALDVDLIVRTVPAVLRGRGAH